MSHECEGTRRSWLQHGWRLGLRRDTQLCRPFQQAFCTRVWRWRFTLQDCSRGFSFFRKLIRILVFGFQEHKCRSCQAFLRLRSELAQRRFHHTDWLERLIGPAWVDCGETAEQGNAGSCSALGVFKHEPCVLRAFSCSLLVPSS